MQILTNPTDLQECCRNWRAEGHSIALVPTMGYFHAGHESLMTYARGVADKLVISLFVNPSQFGPGEDLDAYPHDHERDARIATEHGADVLFMPGANTMYAADHATWVEVPALAAGLCGASRPVHFRGVCTVVLKLLMLTQPTEAVFGQKDWQQLAIIKRMVRDLNVPVRITGRPIVRESDGLALSSRNVYLTARERAQAPAIHAGLHVAAVLAASGEHSVAALADAIRDYWREHLPAGQEEYLSFVHPESLEPQDTVDTAVLCAVAVRLGKARLIDNILMKTN